MKQAVWKVDLPFWSSAPCDLSRCSNDFSTRILWKSHDTDDMFADVCRVLPTVAWVRSCSKGFRTMLETDCERIKEKAIILNGAEPSRTADLGENNPFWAAGSLINCVALAMYWNFSCNQKSHQWHSSAPTAKGGRSYSQVTKSWQSAVEQPQNTYWKQGEAGCLVLSIKPAALFKPVFSMISSLSTSNLYPEWSEGYQGTFIHASSWLGDMKSNSTTRWSPTKTSDIADIALFKYHIYI